MDVGGGLFYSSNRSFYKNNDNNFRVIDLDVLSGLSENGGYENFNGNSFNEVFSNNEAVLKSDKNFVDAIRLVLQRNPEIAQSVSVLASQRENIDIARSQYYPKLSVGISTSNLTNNSSGQFLNLDASQVVYDFGKTSSDIDIEKAKFWVEQTKLLISIDDIAYEVASIIIDIERYRQITNISKQQVLGIQRILNIANMRAKAGIASQADPIQALSYLQSTQSNLIAQNSLLEQYQQRLSILLGFNSSIIDWKIPVESLVESSNLYVDPQFNTIPDIISAQAEILVARANKRHVDLSRYPTFSIKGTLSQALNQQESNIDRKLNSSVLFEATSSFYQGGAISAKSRSASYIEEAARSKINILQMDILDKILTIQEDIKNKQSQIGILRSKQETTVKTRELYQEQYKLGTRSVLDLLNAEISIHSASIELESAKYDIYKSLVQFIKVTGRTRKAYELNNILIQGVEVHS